MTNAKTRLLAAYRAIGPDTINRIMDGDDMPAHVREQHFRGLCPSEPGTFGTPSPAAVERYGQAAYVYAWLHTSWREIANWTGKRDWVAESAKAAAQAELVPLSELTDLELGCRVYSAVHDSERISGELIEEYHRRRRQTYIETALELGLSVHKSSGQSTGLAHQRDAGAAGQSVLALWCVMRDRLDFTAGSED